MGVLPLKAQNFNSSCSEYMTLLNFYSPNICFIGPMEYL